MSLDDADLLVNTMFESIIESLGISEGIELRGGRELSPTG